MKRAGSGAGFAAVSVMASMLASLPASVVHACPMCFNGPGQNQDAFLYGSLALMFVPTTAIGGLLYWAYRRVRAQDPAHKQPPPADVSDAQPAVLHAVPRAGRH